MEIFKKINIRQPKYMLPLILYFPLLIAGYLIFDIFDTEVAEVPDANMQTTEYLNPELPDAQMKGDGIGGKYESMLKSYGRIDDLSAVDNIDRYQEDEKEEYESKYSDEERAQLQSEEERKLAEMQERLAQSARQGQELNATGMTDEERLARASQQEQEAMDELNRALALARMQGAAEATPPAKPDSHESHTDKGNTEGQISVNENSRHAIDENEEPQEVVKKLKVTSDYFNTLTQNEPEASLIKAIIDEDIKAVDGSRVRLRLLDDIEMGGRVLPKGSYLYAIMSGFGSQRVKGTIKSILVGDELVKVSLSLYDTDGLEGLYVPSSNFRETSKDVASGAMNGNMNMGNTATGNSLSQWGMQAMTNAYQKTANAISKAIKKNSAKLKYGTFVYLVNGKEKKND
ncbi:MAG: conjugative transposon protein TraM [Bacteroidaceae bacterium]|nr:conjugative transposon protein TraM [Bacteroidaceae bacterium]